MIPKKIHYCWFGKGKKSQLAENCIRSWKKFCPDYELIEWNEDSFDVFSNRYTMEAFKERKWAFITDYVRLYAIYNYGGIYMDTDVEVTKSLDGFLKNKAFSGFEDYDCIPTGIMASEKENKWIKKLLDYYYDKSFYNDEGKPDLTTNVITITNLTKMNYPIILNNSLQIFEDFTIYPKDFFCPKSYKTGQIEITNNTHTIHHFLGSWMSDEEKKIKEYHQALYKYFPKKTVPILVGIIITFKKEGMKGIFKKIKNKLCNKGC